MRRFDSVEEFASLEEDDLPRLAVDASRLAIAASGTDEPDALEALRKVELGQDDSDAAVLMNALALRLDQDAWTAQEAGDEARYDLLFRKARAVATLAFALKAEPDEAIYEAAHAVGSIEELLRQLTS